MGNYVGGDLARAVAGARAMGYTFRLNNLSLSWDGGGGGGGGGGDVTATVGLENVGVAPFYFPLFLTLRAVAAGACGGEWASEQSLRGVMGVTAVTILIPREAFDPGCARNFSFGFESNMTFTGRPVKLANNRTGFTASSLTVNTTTNTTISHANTTRPPATTTDASTTAATTTNPPATTTDAATTTARDRSIGRDNDSGAVSGALALPPLSLTFTLLGLGSLCLLAW